MRQNRVVWLKGLIMSENEIDILQHTNELKRTIKDSKSKRVKLNNKLNYLWQQLEKLFNEYNKLDPITPPKKKASKKKV